MALFRAISINGFRIGYKRNGIRPAVDPSLHVKFALQNIEAKKEKY